MKTLLIKLEDSLHKEAKVTAAQGGVSLKDFVLLAIRHEVNAWNNGLNEKGVTKMEYQPKTGQPCHCKKGIQRDNCPDCEGTGMRIDFAKIRAATTTCHCGKSKRFEEDECQNCAMARMGSGR